ncbi:purine-nucleoside phosphorylase [Desulfosoma caldarium]|uniref:Purine nucleoside phosphorylase n=1 Tax=Desulfosoma caldarium TaxID=610254 RepID=A0A3N1VS07_9BACT|nr:purine-nucleoside phosphorylase [Desulfosoma caldarium]ROR03022.1 purine-nucleoside phosphorylase [Desulfosoma caldarium]
MTEPSRTSSHLEKAYEVLASTMGVRPRCGLILGTGLGGVVDAMAVEGELSYTAVPHHPVSTVASHQGRYLWGTLAGVDVITLQGRFHLYEGYSPAQIAFPIRLLARLGVKVLILSNAAGGLNPRFEPGDLMLITDHINFTGQNPLVGPNVDALGPRFPDMTEPYCRRLQEIVREEALKAGLRLREGVYVGVLGPSMETAAETRFLRAAGADAVGMSTVMEVIAAVHAGLKVVGISVISNVNRPDCYEPVPLEKVIETASAAGPKLMHLLERSLPRMATALEDFKNNGKDSL